MPMMMDVKVTLDFACCGCEQVVTVTVQCKGKGLFGESANVAAVNVPCPTCQQINHLTFEPSGTVHSVRPYYCFRLLPEPSVN
jgi:hypothetical protein